jgi:4-diphosphocytidyl-2-C-methyl-D-erythritol kinase
VERLADALAQTLIHGAAETEFAPAKINLALHVVGRRPDGYHLLQSLVAFADYGDMMSVSPGQKRTGTSFSVEGPFASELSLLTKTSGNIVEAAARALAEAAGRKKIPPTVVMLTKRIPLIAGLGGGSADAAAALRLLNRYWKLGLSEGVLAEIGIRLGADVPMCLLSKPAIASGIGEVLTPVSGLPPLPIVLVHPAIPLSTARVFGRLENAHQRPLPALPPQFASIIAFVQWLRQTRNDLTEAARMETGLAEAATKALSGDKDCLFARMSGSGASAFGIFASRAAAERAAERLAAAHPHWWVMPAATAGS